MVGLKLFNPNHLGLVTVIAVVTGLFVATVVDGERVLLDTEHESDDFLHCDESSSKSWAIDIDGKASPNKKVFKLLPESEGCFKSRSPISLNSTTKFLIKFHTDSAQEENGNIVVRLVPLDGNCPDNDCIWELTKDSNFKKGEWVVAEHKFPVKSTKEFYVHLKVDKRKGPFLLESLSIPGGVMKYLGESEEHLGTINVPDRLVNENSTAGGCEGLGELSKNLLFTSASVLTLNNILN